ncbi:MAG: sigma 54-interacting transcriptional regulator [Myxococcota bacterium]|nr:sigma 54-interacting transcriptional regulator [Myxococcota bacterium]
MSQDTDATLPDGADEAKGTSSRYVAKLVYDGGCGVVHGIEKLLGSRPLLLGRAVDEPELRLGDPKVSRQHARLWQRSHGGEIIVEDTSTNGTFVNGRRIDTATLQVGDVVRVGGSFLVLCRKNKAVDDASIPGLSGSSEAMCKLRRNIEKVARSSATVLVVGESGTGKELVARAIHELSRRSGPFVPVNCSAIPASLAESQLFGHVTGAFTGAKDHPGYFRMAHGGTIFLDEVGELPLKLQPKLLRVLEERCVMPLAATSAIALDVRVVAATNRDLERAVGEERFRGDLFARLAELLIETPVLRERREDILPLLETVYNGHLPMLDQKLAEALLLHPWPFNAREMTKLAVEIEVHASDEERIGLDLLQHRLVSYNRTSQPPARSDSVAPRPSETESEETEPDDDSEPESKLSAPTRDELVEMLRTCKGNISALGRMLRRSRRQVYRYLETHGLTLEDYRLE